MDTWIGTSGFSYKQWKGPFYPSDLPDREMLDYYAGQLPAVEINNTFYRLPKESVVTGWAAKVPDRFRFSIKASRRITHQKKLADADDETGYLVRVATTLGERLGVILFQLPPYLRKDLPRLEAFLDIVPRTVRAAFEFRHASWMDDDVLDLLASRGRALCVSDMEDGLDAPRLGTTDWGYLRLRRADYDDAALADWAARIRDAGWSEAFVFFKHEDAGLGPAMAKRFIEMLD